MTNTIAVFQISKEEDLRFQLDFVGLDLAGRLLKVNVRERDSGLLKVSLEAPANLILVGTGNLTAFYAKGLMAGWALTEYEADVIDETGGTFTRIMAVRFVYDEPGRLFYGVKGNQATVKWGGNQAVVTAIGGVGPPGPANSLEIGDVDTLEAGELATASITGTAPNQELNLGLPKGDKGDKGWAPVFGLAADGERFVFELTGWSGGEGTPPPITSGGLPVYVGPAGFTTTIGDAFDTRGKTGDKGDQGYKGWSPLLVAVPDGARRVLRVADWLGGEGGKPPTGAYLGNDALVTDIADAVDFRGPPGSVVSPGSIDTADLADGILSADTEGRGKMADGFVATAKVADKAITLAKQADIPTNRMIGRTTGGTGPQEILTPEQARAVMDAVSKSGDTMTGNYATEGVFSAAGGRAILGRSGAPQVFLRDLAAGPDLKCSYFYNSAGQSSIGKLNDAETLATPLVTFDHASLATDFSGSIRHTGDPTTTYALDTATRTTTVANGAVIFIATNFSGRITVCDNISGKMADYLCSAGAIKASAGDTTTLTATYAAPQNGYAVFNNTGATSIFTVMAQRLRDTA